MNARNYPIPWLVARVFAPFAFAYFLSYFLRSTPAILSDVFVDELGLSSSQLGLLAATYFITFAAVQIPLGIALDRFPARAVNAVLLPIASLGCVLFWIGENFWVLMAGRALIGIGVSAALMAALKSVSVWFPATLVPTFGGLISACGGIGAMSATAPLGWILEYLPWRLLFALIALTILGTAAVQMIVIPNDKKYPPPRSRVSHTPLTARQSLALYRHMSTSPFMVALLPVTCVNVAAFMTFQTLWAGPWLRQVVRMDESGVGLSLLMISVAQLAGFVFLGPATRMIRRKTGLSLLDVFLVLVVGINSIILFTALGPTHVPIVFWLLFGLLGISGTTCYVIIGRYVPPETVARMMTIFNFSAFVMIFVVQWGMGLITDLWEPIDGHYPPVAYRTALAAVGVIGWASLGWFLWMYRHHGTRLLRRHNLRGLS